MSKEKKPGFTDQQLYGSDGQPRSADIRQDDLNNCYFLAPMGAITEQQPDRIRDAIRYQPDPKNPDAGVFIVTLHHTKDGIKQIVVTQDDLKDNIDRDGGGTQDNNKNKEKITAPLWPSVIEAAFAKMYDPNPNNKNRSEGYEIIAREEGSGTLSDAMFALTGKTGNSLRYSDTANLSSAPPGNNGYIPPFRAQTYKKDTIEFDNANEAFSVIDAALKAGKPVTLATFNKEVEDGVMEHHAYVVTDIDRRKDGVSLTLRNPYGHNEGVPSEKGDTKQPTITVSLDKMLANKVFGGINIGPEPRVPAQQKDAPQPEASAQPTNGAPVSPASPTAPTSQEKQTPPTLASLDVALDIRNRDHLGHARYQQALDAIEHSPNIPFGTFTGDRLQQAAANLAYTSLAKTERPQGSQNEQLDRIDFAVFNKQCDGMIAGQGELGNPTTKLAYLPAAQDNDTTLTAASQKTHNTLLHMQAQSLDNASQKLNNTQEQSNPNIGPRMV
jgi:Calpain family cysteine protease